LKKRIQKLNNNKVLLGNNKGLSLVELVVTVAIIVALVSVIIASISVIYKARAKTVVEKTGSIISQCKINSLSGIDNEFTLKYDTAKKHYVCTLAKKDGFGGYTSVYKEEVIGNSRVDVSVDGRSIKEGTVLKIRFSNNNGKVEEINAVTGEGAESLLTNSSNNITVTSGRIYNLTLYTLTGEHEIEVA